MADQSLLANNSKAGMKNIATHLVFIALSRVSIVAEAFRVLLPRVSNMFPTNMCNRCPIIVSAVSNCLDGLEFGIHSIPRDCDVSPHVRLMGMNGVVGQSKRVSLAW